MSCQQVRKDKKYELYIVRVGIVDYDTKLAGIHFVARVRRWVTVGGSFVFVN